MSRNLPEIPNLEHLRKQSKALLRELQKREPQAKLAQAQLSIARQYGFASWNKLKSRIESLPAAASGNRGGGETTVDTATGGLPGAGLFPRFTEKARRMVFFARYWAGKRGSEAIQVEHLIRGLLQEEPDLMKRVLGNPAAPESITNGFGTAPADEVAMTQPIPMSDESKAMLQLAASEADRLGHKSIAIGHFWLAFLASTSPAISVLSEVLKASGVSADTARERLADRIHDELQD